jgi:hypothetical protein
VEKTDMSRKSTGVLDPAWSAARPAAPALTKEQRQEIAAKLPRPAGVRKAKAR